MLPQVLLALVVAAGPHDAQVDRLIADGIELRQAGKNDEALALFRKAHELSGSPRALAQCGLAEAALGRWLDAETHLTQALADTQDKWVNANRAALTQTLGSASSKLGWLELAVKPQGARIRVNNQDLGRAPLGRAIRLPAGPAQLDVDAKGYQPVSRTLVVGGGGTTRESVDLKTQALTAGVKASDAAQLSRQEPTPIPPPEPEEPSALDGVPTLAWVTGAVAVVSTGVGVAGTIVEIGCGADCDSSAGVVLMAVGYGLGAVMAGLTVWQLVDAGVVGEEPPAFSWTPVIGPENMGAQLSWRW